MKKLTTRILLVLCMALCLTPITAFATDATVTDVATAQELTNALANSSEEIIRLTADIDIGGTLSISRTVTLDLNGKVLKMTGNGSVITVGAGGNLTLTDSTPGAEHKFTPDATGLWVLDETNGTETLSGGVITSENEYISAGGGVRIAAGGSFTMQGGNIAGCTAREGGGVYVANQDSSASRPGTFTMSGGTIAGCTASTTSTTSDDTRGGGICNFGNVILSGTAVIRNCKAINRGRAYNGGGILSVRNLTIEGNATIRDCTGGTHSDAMYINADVTGKVNIHGGTFSGTVSLSCSNGQSNFTGAVFTDTVYNYGVISDGTFNGTVYNYSTIKGGTFFGTVEGGGTIDDSSKVTVTFDSCGGNTVPEQKILKGQKATPPTAAKNGYNLGGWYNGEVAYDFTTGITEDLTLTAKWTEKSNFTIRFDTTGNTSVTVAGTQIPDKTGVKWTDKVLDGITAPQGIGVIFRGWKCGDVMITPNTTYNNLVQDDSVTEITLTAVWEISGVAGDKGDSGITPTLRIDDNGYWCVSYDNGTTWTSLGVKATGEKGDSGAKGKQGDIGAKGEKGDAGANGSDAVTKSATPAIVVIGIVAGLSLAGNIAIVVYYSLLKKKKGLI